MIASTHDEGMHQLTEFDDPLAPAHDNDHGGESHQEWMLREALRIARHNNGRVIHIRPNRVGQVALFTSVGELNGHD